MQKGEKQRLQFDFAHDALVRLDDMRKKAGHSSRAETVRDALRVYEWLLNEVRPEYTFQVFDQKGKLLTSFKGSLLLK